MNIIKLLTTGLAMAGVLLGPVVVAAEPPDALRVCADPNNLPFSHKNKKGFENKIAEVLAQDMGLRVEYAWFPQRMGFIRNTLRSWVPEENRYKCDLVIGVPAGIELAATTDPYYRSTYALVYRKGQGLDTVKSAQDLLKLPPEKKESLRIGFFAHSPASDWLLQQGLIDQGIPYQIMSGDPAAYPGQIIERDLANGVIDVAVVWGPIGGYFARQISGDVAVIPLTSESQIRFDYSIAMGVRYGDKEWKEQVEALVKRNEPRIHQILQQYNVPLLPVDRRIARE